jgi:DtxR family Mn-dependent transcriptional regulator
MPTSTVENYLKAIYALADGVGREREGLVPVGGIAETLGLTSGTVTTMMKHLSRKGFIDYQPRRGVRLTAEGERTALQVLRRHRLIELFLVEVMHLDWAHVHAEAEVLEHVLSERLVERIDEMLGRPVSDPHGDPIPDAMGLMREDRSRRLSECEAGHYHLIRVTRDDPEFLDWLRDSGLRPGAALRVRDRDHLAGVIEIEIGEATRRIGDAVAADLWVE